MLNLCSGDMGLQAWTAAGLPGAARAWRDSPAVGPWSPDPLLRAPLRAQYWGLRPDARDFQEEAETLQALRQDGSAVLWFSEEPWDQLAQLQVVASLAREAPCPSLELVPLRQGGSGVAPAVMAEAYALRQPMPAEDREEAVRLWERFEAGDWPALWKWLHKGRGIASLPHLDRALARVLEDRPPHVPGRTERQVRDLMAGGVRELPAMMAALAALETPYGLAWYGDLVVGRLMAGLAGRPDDPT
jgi:hypothetical protein